ncbi:MAG: hypothetical protein CMO81_03295 [Waddliaceae bacterium]|nr:hypothetical protein [Waddliaceae bacterium]
MNDAIFTPESSVSLSAQEKSRSIEFLPVNSVSSKWLMKLSERLSARGEKKENAVKEFLIVEDDENNSELLQSLLTFNGLKSSVVRNATEAMVYCQKHTPLAVFMDIGLPGTNGLELAHMLKHVSTMENVPIIAVSAHSSERMRDLAEEVGCVGFIAKPWTPEEILNAV